ncbi:hypothetical protein Mapa_010331 [Marchantia paleacea]|nr:hypothetical protein Mapa_010331 [Marchantia paleacea]
MFEQPISLGIVQDLQVDMIWWNILKGPNVRTANSLRSRTESSSGHDMVEVASNNAAAVI